MKKTAFKKWSSKIGNHIDKASFLYAAAAIFYCRKWPHKISIKKCYQRSNTMVKSPAFKTWNSKIWNFMDIASFLYAAAAVFYCRQWPQKSSIKRCYHRSNTVKKFLSVCYIKPARLKTFAFWKSTDRTKNKIPPPVLFRNRIHDRKMK